MKGLLYAELGRTLLQLPAAGRGGEKKGTQTTARSNKMQANAACRGGVAADSCENQRTKVSDGHMLPENPTSGSDRGP